MTTTRILLLPGWQNSGPGHWQTVWEQQLGFERLQQDDWWWPRRGDWMARLDDALQSDDAAQAAGAAPRPVVLVAHSLGCHLVAAWAAHSQHTARVHAALLVAPPDIERTDMPPQVQAWAPVQRQPLPMPATVVISRDDPYCSAARGAAFAAAWGGERVDAGAGGHLNADSGLGAWPEGQARLRAVMARAGLPPAF